MKPALLLAAAALLAAPLSIGPACAQAVSLHVRTAGDLAEMCSAIPRDLIGAARLNYCNGFAQGVIDLDLRHSATRPFCFPSDTQARGDNARFRQLGPRGSVARKCGADRHIVALPGRAVPLQIG